MNSNPDKSTFRIPTGVALLHDPALNKGTGFTERERDELGLQGCLYLWALLTGQARRLPIAPTKRMSLVVMALLQDHGVIEVPWPEMRWEFKQDAQNTPIEGLQWRLAWTVYEPARLLEALDDYFDTLEQTDYTVAVGLRLWSDLAPAEAERYFEQQ